MKTVFAPILAATLAISASSAYAGGPVVVVEEPVPVVEEQSGSSSGAVLPLLLVGIALCVALCD